MTSPFANFSHFKNKLNLKIADLILKRFIKIFKIYIWRVCNLEYSLFYGLLILPMAYNEQLNSINFARRFYGLKIDKNLTGGGRNYEFNLHLLLSFSVCVMHPRPQFRRYCIWLCTKYFHSIEKFTKYFLFLTSDSKTFFS